MTTIDQSSRPHLGFIGLGGMGSRMAGRLLAAGYGNGAEPLNEKQADPALLDINKAIELNPEYADAYAVRGRLLNAMKKFERAVGDCSKAIGLDPKNAIALGQRALAYRNLGREKEANHDLARAKEFGWNE